MTVIVGLCDGQNVWMGADSFVGNDEYVLSGKSTKIVKRKRDGEGILIGAAGDHRGSHLISRVDIPPHPAYLSDLDYIAGPFVDSVRSLYQEKGWLEKTNEREGGNCHALIGYRGQLFSIWDGFEVVETADDYMAIGSGMYIALGALAVTKDMLMQFRLEEVLEAVEKHSPYVRRPFQIEHVATEK